MDCDLIISLICVEINQLNIVMSSLHSPPSSQNSASPPAQPLTDVHSPVPSLWEPCSDFKLCLWPQNCSLHLGLSICRLRLDSIHLQLHWRSLDLQLLLVPSSCRHPLGQSSHHFCLELAGSPLHSIPPLLRLLRVPTFTRCHRCP